MATSLDSIFSSLQNAVNALSHIQDVIIRGQGNATSQTVTVPTLICTGFGRLVSVTVTVAGTTAGTISNAGSLPTVAASNALISVPATLGVLTSGQTFNLGLVITPGTGQSLNVTYHQNN